MNSFFFLFSRIGADFSDEEKIASTTSPNVKTASGVISVEDDNINENPQVFFLLAKVTLDSHLPLTKVCFKKNEKDINCTGNGTALVAILDNDRELFSHSSIKQPCDKQV